IPLVHSQLTIFDMFLSLQESINQRISSREPASCLRQNTSKSRSKPGGTTMNDCFWQVSASDPGVPRIGDWYRCRPLTFSCTGSRTVREQGAGTRRCLAYPLNFIKLRFALHQALS